MNNEQMLTIEFTSDWHVGEGAGQPGHIDRIVRRDRRDGLPYVPAKTVTGIWRDGCERVAAGLDNGDRGGWTAWVDFLFGDQPNVSEQSKAVADAPPRPAVLEVRAACFPDPLRRLLVQEDMAGLKAALTFGMPGIKIEDCGHAKDD
nr:RAMP superfamily CRISPR-associated protein [Pseudomonadota bacterium]